MKLLVIEDDADLREIIVRSLEKERYVVETAADCATARMKVFVYEYDCLLLDIMLPDGSGLDILREMSARGRKCNVIILSAKDSIEDKVTGLDLGAALPRACKLGHASWGRTFRVHVCKRKVRPPACIARPRMASFFFFLIQGLRAGKI